jgi:hypothetical protein
MSAGALEMRRATLVLMVVAFGLASVPVRALCRKMMLEEQYAGSAVVFVGRATAQEAEARTRVLGTTTKFTREEINTATTFTVEEMWKGAPAPEVRVATCGGVLGDRHQACDPSFTFRIGSSYLVFASGEPLQSSECVPTALLERASDTLEWLAKKPRTKIR